MPSARLAAVVAFALNDHLLAHSARKAILDLSQSPEIFAGGREIVLMQKLADRQKFAMFDARSSMNARLQFFDEPFRVPLMLFRRHFPRNRSSDRDADNCAFERTLFFVKRR